VPDSIVVPLRSIRQRKALALQKLNHAIPAFGLLLAGKQAIAEGGHGFGFYLGVFELVSAAALIVLTIRELRSAIVPVRSTSHAPIGTAEHVAGHAEHHGVDWVDIAAGFVLVAEALEHWHTTGHVPRPTVLTALVTFALGLLHGRLKGRVRQRRVLRLDDAGIAIAGRPFKARRIEARWADVQSIDIGDRWAVVTTRAGRQRRLDLADLETARDVRAALAEGQRRLAAAPLVNTAE
jgi:hypothetical protein